MKMVEEFRHQCMVNIRPCQLVARVKSVIELSETALSLAASGGISVVDVQPFAGFYLLNKTVKEIPDIARSDSAAIRAFTASSNCR